MVPAHKMTTVNWSGSAWEYRDTSGLIYRRLFQVMDRPAESRRRIQPTVREDGSLSWTQGFLVHLPRRKRVLVSISPWMKKGAAA